MLEVRSVALMAFVGPLAHEVLIGNAVFERASDPRGGNAEPFGDCFPAYLARALPVEQW